MDPLYVKIFLTWTPWMSRCPWGLSADSQVDGEGCYQKLCLLHCVDGYVWRGFGYRHHSYTYHHAVRWVIAMNNEIRKSYIMSSAMSD